MSKSLDIDKGQSNTLIFIHIPKTAGTSLRRIIENFYREDEIFFVYSKAADSNDVSDYKALSDAEKKKIKIIYGHNVSFNFHKYIPHSSSYVTILRNPVERLISMYSFITNEPAHPFYKIIKSDNMNFDDFIREDKMQWGRSTDNLQTRMLCGMKAEFRKCYPEMVKKAKENLRDHFAVVGLSEYFVESVLLMKNTFGWTIPISRQIMWKMKGIKSPYSEKANVTQKRLKKDELPDSSIDLVKKYNELDIELYDYAKDLFLQRIATQGPRFMKEVEKIKSKQLI